jgi:benzoate membrane transport protein
VLVAADRGSLRESIPAVGAAASVAVVFVAVLAVPLAVASQLGLTEGQTTGWIVALYGMSGVLSLAMVARYRQPLLLTGNVFMLIFIASLGTQLRWSELVGAAVVAGAVVLVSGQLGWTGRLALWLPAPIVFGLLAGAVLPFVLDIFVAILGGDVRGAEVSTAERLMIGGALVAYVVGRRTLEPRLPAVLPALVVGTAIAAVSGDLTLPPSPLRVPVLSVTAPTFSLAAIVTATPVMVVLIALQANLPSIVFLRSQGYEPPEAAVTRLSGVGTLLGSFLGPMGVSLSLPATALTAGPAAGPKAARHRAASLAAGGAVLIALLAGLAAELATIVPRAFLFAMAGLALLGVLSTALEHMTSGPLRLGPLFAFAIALLDSDLSLLGLGPFFWALVTGLAVSLVLERGGWHALREEAPERGSDGEGMRDGADQRVEAGETAP